MSNSGITPDFFHEVSNEIKKWEELIGKEPNNEVLYELAFFKIYLKFEKVYVNAFIEIMCNTHIYKGNKINYRILPLFTDDEKNERTPFETFLKSISGSSYYLSIDKISDLHKEFMFEPNPFFTIHSDVNYQSKLRDMVIIRNFFAHESQDAKKKYITHFNYDSDKFESPSILLRTKLKGRNITRLSSYIKTIEDIINLIVHDTKPE